MILKVCGIREQQNYNDLSGLDIDMIGINFYKPSSRYIGDHPLIIGDHQKRVGVFVASTIKKILKAKEEYNLDYAQLHGDEDVIFCKEAQKYLPIIKVFRVSADFDWTILEKFSFADFFLFDTMTAKFGGSGHKFDWSILQNYNLETPFLLSGGIGPMDAAAIKSISHHRLAGVDINSKFELSPAVKDVSQIRHFINELKL